MLQEEARLIAENMEIKGFSASNGWLQSFNKQQNLHRMNTAGEDGDVNEKVLESWDERAREITILYFTPAILNLLTTQYFTLTILTLLTTLYFNLTILVLLSMLYFIGLTIDYTTYSTILYSYNTTLFAYSFNAIPFSNDCM